jgi:predicted RecB family nuclease
MLCLRDVAGQDLAATRQYVATAHMRGDQPDIPVGKPDNPADIPADLDDKPAWSPDYVAGTLGSGPLGIGAPAGEQTSQS